MAGLNSPGPGDVAGQKRKWAFLVRDVMNCTSSAGDTCHDVRTEVSSASVDDPVALQAATRIS